MSYTIKTQKGEFMNIALIAHDTKKELMSQFSTAYCGILSKHNLHATGGTAKLVGEAVGLKAQRYLGGVQGGVQQITSSISCGEIDILFFFRETQKREIGKHDDMDILRVCDVHNIPTATNIATAEALILALQRGDLDWIKGDKIEF